MARFVEERNAKFIDEFKAAVPCFWGVSEPYYHRGDMRNCDMYRNAAAIRGYGDNLMTGECSKIRSGEFLVFRSRHAVAVPVCGCGFLSALQKSYFPLAFVFAPDQKAHTYTHTVYRLNTCYRIFVCTE